MKNINNYWHNDLINEQKADQNTIRKTIVIITHLMPLINRRMSCYLVNDDGNKKNEIN